MTEPPTLRDAIAGLKAKVIAAAAADGFAEHAERAGRPAQEVEALKSVALERWREAYDFARWVEEVRARETGGLH